MILVTRERDDSPCCQGLGAENSAPTVATLFEALGALGMTAVRNMGMRVGPAVNAAILRATADMLAQGGSPCRNDAALRGFGFELGTPVT